MWKIRKTISQLGAFDQEIRPILEYFGLPPLPDKQSFSHPRQQKLKPEDQLCKVISIQYLSCLIFQKWYCIIFVNSYP